MFSCCNWLLNLSFFAVHTEYIFLVHDTVKKYKCVLPFSDTSSQTICSISNLESKLPGKCKREGLPQRGKDLRTCWFLFTLAKGAFLKYRVVKIEA
jgi:hypothetical protein